MLSMPTAVRRSWVIIIHFQNHPDTPKINSFDRFLFFTMADLIHEWFTPKARGAVILAPPGAGKSYWIQKHPEAGWEDADMLYEHDENFEGTASEEEKEAITGT